MTRFSRSWLAVAALAIVSAPALSVAQGAPGAPGAPQGAAVQSKPATPPAPLTANPVPVPPDSAVALCMDNTFVKDPGTIADCGKHGGLRVAMPPHGNRVLAPKASPAFAVRPAAANQAPPAGATLRCKDGTYLSGNTDAARCANNGGLAAILPAQSPSLPPPKRP